jgi:CheY-like chemotaxis protein
MKQTDLASPIQPPAVISPPLLAGGCAPSGVTAVKAGDSGSSGQISDGCNSGGAQNGVVPGKRVLIVDDEAAILFGFKKILQRGGVEVDTAETVEEALNLLQTKDYQFVITDLKLSGSSADNGFDIIRFAKGKRPETKIILITGYGTPEIMEKALSLGAAYYYEKPVSGTVLRDVLIRVGM